MPPATRTVPNLHRLRSEQTRERLLNAALDVIGTSGPSGFSIHEVARTAGMTGGAVQHHFPNRAALMLEVLSRLIDSLERDADFWPPSHWSLRRRADHFVHQAWARLYGQPRFGAAWSAYLAVREDPAMRAHIVAERARLTTGVFARLRACFPGLCAGRRARARAQFVLSSLRGMGLVRPFAPDGAIPAQLAVLSAYIQSFPDPQETST